MNWIQRTRGKVHREGNADGHDSTMCNGFYQPRFYAKGVSRTWRGVTCKLCLARRPRKTKESK